LRASAKIARASSVTRERAARLIRVLLVGIKWPHIVQAAGQPA
jgi:hypothetical protein